MIFCVCLSVLSFFASLYMYYKRVNINYLEIHARSPIYIFWTMAYWLINPTTRKPIFFWRYHMHMKIKNQVIWKFACLMFTSMCKLSPYWWDFSHESRKEHESFLQQKSSIIWTKVSISDTTLGFPKCFI